MKIYSNGSLDASKTTTIANLNSTPSDEFVIGRFQGGFFYDGTIDDVRVYNRALSADEIKRLYNIGR